MAYRLGCELADRIAAVGAVAGTIITTDCRPARPVSIIDIHGTADKLYPYEGEPVNGLTYPSTPANLERWRLLDGCAGPVQTTSAVLVTVHSYSGCRNGTALTSYVITGGGHDWTSGADPAGVDATQVVWEFFAAHPKTAGQ
jgi:polyhydroxybutyrate depolymerase